MRPLTFYMVMLVSLCYAMVMIVDAHEYTGWSKEADDLRDYQPKVTRADQINRFAQQLVRRMAIDSTRDDALIKILKGEGVTVTALESQDGGSQPIVPKPASSNLSSPLLMQ